jgi:hypothetical protein
MHVFRIDYYQHLFLRFFETSKCYFKIFQRNGLHVAGGTFVVSNPESHKKIK